MNRIDTLKAAHEAADPGEWDWHDGINEAGVEFVSVERYLPERPPHVEIMLSGTGTNTANVEYIALAHNMMPNLIAAFELLEVAVEFGLSPVVMAQAKEILTKLKEEAQ